MFRQAGFLEKHINSEGKNPKYEIQEEILYQFLTLLIEILKKWHKYLPRCLLCKEDVRWYNKIAGKKFVISTKNIIAGVEIR